MAEAAAGPAVAPALEFRRLSADWVEPLTRFFDDLQRAGDERYFHPHPLNRVSAENVCAYPGRDLYYAAAQGDRVLAYGMLRGWDEGYEVPSLGIATHPDSRGSGLGLALMLFLHTAARGQGASRVRLKVDRSNSRAIGLYRKLGYTFAEHGPDDLVGHIEL